MKTLFQLSSVIACISIMSACKTISDTHSSRNSLDWAGTYKGMVSVNGKETVAVLSLQNDLIYRMQTAVTDELDKVTESSGSFSWDKNGGEIVLKDAKTNKKTSFKAGENILQETGNKASPLILEKIQQESITEKYWKLIEIQGKPVASDESMRREPFIILKNEGNRVIGNGGCNSLTGSYETDQMNRIRFSQIASTMMMCLQMEIETGLKKALETTDHYTLSADGKYLSLNRAQMAPLARFEAVYLR